MHVGKVTLSAILSVLVLNVFSQTRELTGTVRDDHGFALPFISVMVSGSRHGVNTDANGVYHIKVKPDAQLLFSGVGFSDTLVGITGDRLDVAMTPKANQLGNVTVGAVNGPNTPAPEAAYQQDVANILNEFTSRESIISGTSFGSHVEMDGKLRSSVTTLVTSPTGADVLNNPNGATSSSAPYGAIYRGTAVPSFSHAPETRGSRYLYESWVSGEAVNTMNEPVRSEKLKFNYDKIRKQIMVTEDFKTVIEVNSQGVRSVTMEGNPLYTFEHVPAIGEGFLLKIGGKAGGFNAYKSINTHYEKANYHSDGLVESGKDYNEYADQYYYYVVFPGARKFIRLELKRKPLKDAFANNPGAERFFKEHRYDPIDELFLIGLTDAMNK